MYNAFYTTHKAKLFIKKCEESKLRSLRKRRGFFFLYDLDTVKYILKIGEINGKEK